MDTAAVMVEGKSRQDVRMLMATPRLDAGGEINENNQMDAFLRLP